MLMRSHVFLLSGMVSGMICVVVYFFFTWSLLTEVTMYMHNSLRFFLFFVSGKGMERSDVGK